MSTTLVAVFETEAEAHEACKRLQALGIDRNLMRVARGEAAPILASAKPAARRAKAPGAVRRIISNLFSGLASQGTPGLPEAASRDHAVLTLRLVNEARADAIGDLLEDCGATHIDERVDAWDHSGRGAAVGAAAAMPGKSMERPYTGVERRFHRASYAHAERRSANR